MSFCRILFAYTKATNLNSSPIVLSHLEWFSSKESNRYDIISPINTVLTRITQGITTTFSDLMPCSICVLRELLSLAEITEKKRIGDVFFCGFHLYGLE